MISPFGVEHGYEVEKGFGPVSAKYLKAGEGPITGAKRLAQVGTPKGKKLRPELATPEMTENYARLNLQRRAATAQKGYR